MQEAKTIMRSGSIRPAKLILDPQLSDAEITALNSFTFECPSSETGAAKMPVWNLIAQAILDLVTRNARDHIIATDAAVLAEAYILPKRPEVSVPELCDHIYGILGALPVVVINLEQVYEEPIRTILVKLYQVMVEYAPQIMDASMWSMFENHLQVMRFDANMLEIHFTRPV